MSWVQVPSPAPSGREDPVHLGVLGFLNFWWEHAMTDEPRPEQETAATATETPPEEVKDKEEGQEEEFPKLQQAVEMRDVGPCKKYIKVTIERDGVATRLNAKYSELRLEANVP